MATPIATPPTQGAGAAPPADGQTGSGQPTGQGQGQGGFNWGLFPSVPEEQRTLLEPHLRDVLGHVTKVEQQWAPYKFLQESGVQADQLRGILSFSEAFDKDPVGTWYSMAQQMAENGVLPEDLDVEDLGRILQGLPPADQGAPQGQGQPGQPQMTPEMQGMMQMFQQMLAPLTEKLQGVENYVQSQQQRETQRTQDQLLTQSLTGMKDQLKAAGFPEEIFGNEEGQISDQYLTGQIVAHRGDVSTAVQSINTLRNGILKGFAGGPTPKPGQGELNMPNGAPPTPGKAEASARNKGDGFSEARAGAENFLRQAQNASAQQ